MLESLESLAEHARKFSTAEEFASSLFSVSNKYDRCLSIKEMISLITNREVDVSSAKTCTQSLLEISPYLRGNQFVAKSSLNSIKLKPDGIGGTDLSALDSDLENLIKRNPDILYDFWKEAN